MGSRVGLGEMIMQKENLQDRSNRITERLHIASRKRLTAALAFVLSLAVVLGVVRELTLPASTMTTICGKEEHVHTDACYTLLLKCDQVEG